MTNSHTARLAPEALEDRSLPAPLTFVNDNWHLFFDANADGMVSRGDLVTNTNDPDSGPLTAYEYGVTGFGKVTSGPFTGAGSLPQFDSINDAIEVTDVGGIVTVLAGTYNESVSVDKTLTLLGAQAGVDARTRTGVPESVVGSAGGAFQLLADDIVLDGFTISGVTGGLAAGISAGSATGYQIRNNIITNNVIGVFANSTGASLIERNLFDGNNNPGSSGGAGIYSEVSNDLTIDNNEFRNHTLNNPILFAALSTVSHTGLTVTDNFLHDNSFGIFALSINGGLFQGNTITTGGTETALTFGGSNTAVDVLNNDLSGNARGVHVADFGFLGVTPNSDIEVFSNNLAGNSEFGLGIIDGSTGYTGTLDASGNWWGSVTGPTVASNPNGTGSAIVDPAGQVDYSPWLASGTDTSAAAGFQGDFTTLVVNPGSPRTAAQVTAGTGNLQEGIDRVTVGGTVIATAGTYAESVNVNKTVTLLGAQAGVATGSRTGGGAGESVVLATGGAGFSIGASGVTIDGFSVTAGTSASNGIAETGPRVGTVVSNNFVSGFTGSLGIAIAAASSDFQITGNDVSNNYGGIYLSAGAGNGTVSGNFIHDHTGTTAPDEGSGFIFEGDNAGVSVTQNVIQGNRFGVYAFDFGGNFTGTALFNNSIVGNTQGVNNTNATVLNAAGNWWGVATAAGVAAQAGANVDYSPWLATGTDTGAAAGFQGDFAALVVGAASPQTGPVGGIQEGVNLVTVGGTVDVTAGTYVENVTINKNLTLRSTDGRAATTIQGVSNAVPLAVGTVVVTNNTSAVTIGGIGRGFTIIGIDNGLPGIENAAVYFQGNHTGAQVIGNDIRANGDHGFVTEFGATISGFVIDSNIFSGQTFTGTTPATGNQFTVPNVARQLVVMGNGGGDLATATTTNITFTNNQITGTAGANGAGNSLVTLDVANSTITGNTFTGATSGFGSALRARRPGTTISGNTFDSTDMTAGTNQLVVQNSATPLETIVAANTFDRGTYVNGGVTVSVSLNGGAGAATTGSTLRILPGTYAENLDLTAAGVNKALTLAPVAGAVTIAGDLTLDGNDALVLDIGDVLSVTGTLTAGGAALTVVGGGGAPVGAPVVLINSGTTAGTFAGLPQGATVTSGGQSFAISYTGGDGNDITLTAQAPVTPPVSPPPAPPAPAAPFFSGATVIGTFLILQGAGVPGGVQVLQVPLGSFALFTDVSGDGQGDVILFTPTLAVVADGATGRLLAVSTDLNGDGVRDLQLFNPDGTSATTDGRTGIRIA